MRKHQIEDAAYEVATQVRMVEDTIETALAEIAELQARMVRARGVTRAGMVASHAAFEQLAATTNGLIAARGGMPRGARRDAQDHSRAAHRVVG